MTTLVQIVALMFRFSADMQVPIPSMCAQEVAYFDMTLDDDGYTASGPESLCAKTYFDKAAAAEDDVSGWLWLAPRPYDSGADIKL